MMSYTRDTRDRRNGICRETKKKGNNPLFMINDRLGEADKVGVNVRIFSIIIHMCTFLDSLHSLSMR